MKAFHALVVVCSLWVARADAFDFSGDKALIAVTKEGTRTRMGRVSFTPAANGQTGFQVQMDPTVMRDYFLSMREFKCLPSAVEVNCHVPYPYRHTATVSATDLVWLEHNLLFLYKQPSDFGAKLWNGLMFSFRVTPGALVGKPQAVDLNAISAPPDRLDIAPYGAMDRHDFAFGERWLNELRIE